MTDNPHQQKIHATAVAIGSSGVLLTGPSGIGKSDLALRLIDRGAVLIGDDYVDLQRVDHQIMISAPQTISGKMEIRSLGIFDFDIVSPIALDLLVQLELETERFPMDRQTEMLMTLAIPRIRIDPRPASAPIKVELALQRLLSERDASR